MPDSWNPVFTASHACFRQLPVPGAWRDYPDWPECTVLSALLPAGLQMRSCVPIRFLPQNESIPFPDLYYEERIFQHGIVATRPANWHDFLNALIWIVYPQTKIMISRLHAADLQMHGKQRTQQRDALTLFDENGVILAASRRQLLQHVLDFSWHSLFWEERVAWGKEIACFVAGHALLEKMLTPYMGISAHALLLEVEEDFFSQPLLGQQAYLDEHVADILQKGTIISPSQFNPLPVLGIPGWGENNTEDFYDNPGYFRAKSRPRSATIIG